MHNIFKVTFVIIGTIIGAGFISGQEILTFFNRYGGYGLIGLIISLALISIIIYKTLKKSSEKDINSYQKFIEEIIPCRLKQNKILIFTINNIINIFLLISFNIMVAGFSTFFLQEYSISKVIGSIVIATFTCIVLLKGINGVVKINTYLIPIIILLIIFLGINKINSLEIIKRNNTLYWCISSILYSSYNSICLVPILISLKNHVKNKKEARIYSMLYIYNNTYLSRNNLFTFKLTFFYNYKCRNSCYKYS